MRSWLPWLLPFLVSVGMAIGATIGVTELSSVAGHDDPAGAGALIVGFVSISVGFIVSMLTIIVSTLLRRGPPTRLAFRFVLSLAAGALIGELAPNSTDVVTALTWIFLIGAPLVLSWPSQRKS